ncbi:MAG: GntR family transcriptional regulator [Anaerolineae bacterium]
MALTNAEIAYQLLKEKIITVEMLPGSLIQESQLMEQLNLGRTPIREALKQLETDRLVVTAPHRGTFVAEVQITDLQQIYEIRRYLEGLCARLAAERATPEQITEMENFCQQMAQPETLETRTLILMDRYFHNLLAKAANNRFIIGEIEHFYNLSLRLWHLSLPKVKSIDLDTNRHFLILQAIKDRSADCAEELMRQHIQHFQETIRSTL